MQTASGLVWRFFDRRSPSRLLALAYGGCGQGFRLSGIGISSATAARLAAL